MGVLVGPYIVPLAVFVWLSIVFITKTLGQAQARRVNAEQRMVMLQRGMTPEQIAVVLQPIKEDEEEEAAKIKDPLRNLGNARRTAIVLVSVGFGIVVFGLLLTAIVRDREVLTVAAAGLIPFAIGIGFFVDYNLQKRELSRFGLEVGADSPSNNRPR
jgi:Flp pilus assembly protein TadB